MMSKQEVLPPESDADRQRGRFAPGHSGNPDGRPAGIPNKHTQELRDMVREALDGLGGVNYLIFMGATRPDLFLPLVGRTLPLKLSTDAGAPIVMVVSERIVTHAPKK